jgi:hypothetical protein
MLIRKVVSTGMARLTNLSTCQLHLQLTASTFSHGGTTSPHIRKLMATVDQSPWHYRTLQKLLFGTSKSLHPRFGAIQSQTRRMSFMMVCSAMPPTRIRLSLGRSEYLTTLLDVICLLYCSLASCPTQMVSKGNWKLTCHRLKKFLGINTYRADDIRLINWDVSIC